MASVVSVLVKDELRIICYVKTVDIRQSCPPFSFYALSWASEVLLNTLGTLNHGERPIILWLFSGRPPPLDRVLCLGCHSEWPYSSVGRTSDLNNCRNTPVFKKSKDLLIRPSILLAFVVDVATCYLKLSLLSTWTPRSFSTSLSNSMISISSPSSFLPDIL